MLGIVHVGKSVGGGVATVQPYDELGGEDTVDECDGELIGIRIHVPK